MFLDHAQRSTTVGRTPLDEWSARRRDLYLTTHDTHSRQISMPPVRFEPTIWAGERPACKMACTEFSSDNFYIKRWNVNVLFHFENRQVFLPHPVYICDISSLRVNNMQQSPSRWAVGGCDWSQNSGTCKGFARWVVSLLISFRKIRGHLFPGPVLRSGADSCHEVCVIPWVSVSAHSDNRTGSSLTLKTLN